MSFDWIGKKAVVTHHLEVPYRLVHCAKKFGGGGDTSPGNLLVQGDNLEVLRALLPYYAKRVKCIYIDPPYNTGNEGWQYNDRVNSPRIRRWLNKTVGGEADDLCRHDKWLCMMYPRLRLLRDFLRQDGVIFISIDDNEQHHLRVLMDEIFGANNFIAQIIAQTNPRGRSLSQMLAKTHEYVLAYARNADKVELKEVPKSKKTISEYTKEDSCGKYRLLRLLNTGAQYFNRETRPNLFYPIYVNPEDKTVSVSETALHSIAVSPITSSGLEGCWTWSKEKVEKDAQLVVGKRIRSGEWRIFRKDYLPEHGGTTKERALWTDKEINHEVGKEALNDIFGKAVFEFPKSPFLIAKCVQMVCDKDSIILDSFAGSGTTAHAVLQQNKEDGGNRRFVLVEMEKEISEKVAAKRIQAVIEGYTRGNKTFEPLGGEFRLCTLGVPLFDKNGNISDEVKFSDLAAHIFFSATGTPIPKHAKSPLLGVHQGRAIYLLFNGIIGDQRKEGGNMLTIEVLRKLPEPPTGVSLRVVFAEGTLLSEERLAREKIEFCQIPYRIRMR